jgi:predicted RNA binding protein YcfA (HicA-like mRNA interferase family)
MAKRDKRIAAMRRNPSNVRPDDLDVVLRAAGFTMRQQGTSHKVYTRGEQQVVVPQHRPFLKAAYLRRALAVLGEEKDG